MLLQGKRSFSRSKKDISIKAQLISRLGLLLWTYKEMAKELTGYIRLYYRRLFPIRLLHIYAKRV